jgi:predicted nucleotidyltransferase
LVGDYYCNRKQTYRIILRNNPTGDSNTDYQVGGRKCSVSYLRIILFGSRAKKQERPDSDWDFFVIIDKDIAFYLFGDIISNTLK